MADAKPKRLIAKYEYKKTTPGTHQYNEIVRNNGSAVTRSLYITKDTIGALGVAGPAIELTDSEGETFEIPQFITATIIETPAPAAKGSKPKPAADEEDDTVQE